MYIYEVLYSFNGVFECTHLLWIELIGGSWDSWNLLKTTILCLSN